MRPAGGGGGGGGGFEHQEMLLAASEGSISDGSAYQSLLGKAHERND